MWRLDKTMKRIWITLALTSLMAVTWGETSHTLAAYLVAHPWNVAKNGPLLVVGPEAAKAVSEPKGFESFQRKAIALDGITTLAPLETIYLDDAPLKSATAYSSLPRTSKVLYLLQSLSDEQWRKVASVGITFEDLSSDQKTVLDSIVAKPFKWTSYRTSPDGRSRNVISRATLSPQERQGVRLRLEREMFAWVEMPDRPRETVTMDAFGPVRDDPKMSPVKKTAPKAHSSARTQINFSDTLVQSGKPYTELDEPYVNDFGLGFQRVSGPELKASDLDYSLPSLTVSVPIKQESKVSEIIQQISSACGIEIIPDYRVSNRAVITFGDHISGRALLESIALSVGGTYRKVGTSYVLTSDLVGAGELMYRAGFLGYSLSSEVQKLDVDFREAVSNSPGLRYVQFPTGELAPTQDLVDVVNRSDSGGENWIPISELTPGMRQHIARWNERRFHGTLKVKEVSMSSNYSIQFVLPNGIALRSSGVFWLPRVTHPQTSSPSRSRVESQSEFPVQVASEQRLTFLAPAEDSATVRKIIEVLRPFPGCQLWLDTHSPEALASALSRGKQAGIAIGLAIKPWRVPSSDVDRNIAGESGQKIIDRLSNLHHAPWKNSDYSGSISAWLTPTSPSVNNVWSQYRQLAHTPGLCGVMLLETDPPGYQIPAPLSFTLGDGLMIGAAQHGYTLSQRLMFLRQAGIDPIDIDEPMRIFTSTYFSSTWTIVGNFGITSGMRDEWRRFLVKRNEEDIARLLDMFSDLTVYIERRGYAIGLPYSSSGRVFEWKKGDMLISEITRDDVGIGSRLGCKYDPFKLIDSGSRPPSYSSSGYIVHAVNGTQSAANDLLISLEGIRPERLRAVMENHFIPPVTGNKNP